MNTRLHRLVFRNATDYPDAEVARLVRFAAADLDWSKSHGSILVRLVWSRPSEKARVSGRAYNYVTVLPDVPDGARYEVRLRLGREHGFPRKWWDRRGAAMQIGEVADWREALVVIAAHELKHVERFQQFAWRDRANRRGRSVEAACDAYAARRLADFRLQERHLAA